MVIGSTSNNLPRSINYRPQFDKSKQITVCQYDCSITSRILSMSFTLKNLVLGRADEPLRYTLILPKLLTLASTTTWFPPKIRVAAVLSLITDLINLCIDYILSISCLSYYCINYIYLLINSFRDSIKTLYYNNKLRFQDITYGKR